MMKGKNNYIDIKGSGIQLREMERKKKISPIKVPTLIKELTYFDDVKIDLSSQKWP